MKILDIARQVFEIERAALKTISNKLDANFEKAVGVLLQCSGRIIVCGMGKSGLIGKKIAATFASIGRPAFFIHPSEAIHGDLGMIMQGDCFLSISNSGETDELLQLIPHIEKMGLAHISLTGVTESTLAKHANIVLNIAVETEASNLQAVPMASAMAALAMGDALAAALIHVSGFRQEDFAVFHPGGSLGRKILTKVADLMRKTDLPLIQANSSLREVLMIMSKGMLGLAIVCDSEQKILGIITDGDLRRALENSKEEIFFSLSATDIMTKNPKQVSAEASLLEAEEMMNQHKITSLLVLKNGFPEGILSKQMIR
jgi:arabinose-5-phosphate isomerase